MKFTVPGKVRGKERPRKGRYGGMYTPKMTVEYEQHIRDSLPPMPDCFEPLAGPFQLLLRAYVYPTKKFKEEFPDAYYYWGTPDIDNIEKVVLDALNGVLFVDDAQCVSVVKTKIVALKPEDECVYVEIGGIDVQAK